MDRQITALRKGVDVVVGTPGRLIDLMERGELSVAEVEVLVLDEADRMADMGFMPQVQKVLYRIDATAPDDAVLGDARRRGEPTRRALPGRSGPARGRGDRAHRRGDGPPLLPRPPDGQGQGRGVDRRAASSARSSSCARSAAPIVSSRSSSARACSARRSTATCARARASSALADFIAGKVSVLVATDVAARGHPRRRGRRGRALRPGRGPQGLPAPLGPHGTRRGERRRRHAPALEPGERHARHPAPSRPRRSRWSRSSPTILASPISRTGMPPRSWRRKRPKSCGSCGVVRATMGA